MRTGRSGREFVPDTIRRNQEVPVDSRLGLPHRVDREVGSEAYYNLAFSDAYFSNYIEGTRFPVADGARDDERGARLAGGTPDPIPTAFRTDYMGALRRLTRQDDPQVLIRALDRAQDFTSRIDFTDYGQARTTMERCGAFGEGDEARIRMPPET